MLESVHIMHRNMSKVSVGDLQLWGGGGVSQKGGLSLTNHCAVNQLMLATAVRPSANGTIRSGKVLK